MNPDWLHWACSIFFLPAPVFVIQPRNAPFLCSTSVAHIRCLIYRRGTQYLLYMNLGLLMLMLFFFQGVCVLAALQTVLVGLCHQGKRGDLQQEMTCWLRKVDMMGRYLQSIVFIFCFQSFLFHFNGGILKKHNGLLK